ncbi:MAG TPA: molybdenum cofactor biosynthesis protein MoaE [Microscillaceae bacterium]|jgi:molybdopterin synthase catalytic subunit|nr:molybdenum cofactor biosynthesis protein MoaE [Microscillaceae bacterium]
MPDLLLISPLSLDETALLAEANTPAAGAVVSFKGTCRNQTDAQKVVQLFYEAYEPMALQEMQRLTQLARQQWKVHNIVIAHRVGTLLPGDIAVLIAVSTSHRKEAFEACAFLIDTLKQTVPIWKKEFFENGEVWVAAHP